MPFISVGAPYPPAFTLAGARSEARGGREVLGVCLQTRSAFLVTSSDKSHVFLELLGLVLSPAKGSVVLRQGSEG